MGGQLLLLASTLRLGDGNIVRLSAGDAAEELGAARAALGARPGEADRGAFIDVPPSLTLS